MTIFSTGDGAFLEEVLNAVAMVMKQDQIITIGAIGILLGVVAGISSSLLQNGKSIPLTGPIIGALMFMVMFIPRVDVVINDTYSHTMRPVDNVPMGIGVAGFAISSIGRYVTEVFETAYTLPGTGMAGSGYATPLEMLLSVRKEGLGSANSIGSDNKDNFVQSLSNYVKDCTNTGLMRGDISEGEIMAAEDTWEAIKWNSEAYTTKTFLKGEGSDGAEHDCTDAYDAMDTEWSDRMDAWEDYLDAKTGASSSQLVIGDALNTLVKTGLDAQTYMRNSFLAKIIRRVSSGGYGPDTELASAVTNQAVEQSRIQFAAESTVFAHFARPLMTFVEGFVYALTPFMAFIVGIGMGGLKLVGRYVLILFWVQLWMPIMSLSNLFVQMSFKSEMDSLTATTYGSSSASAISLLGLSDIQGQASDWVAVAGNMVGATPALALTVLYGGAYTMVNMANRITPGDTIDESQAAPSQMQNEPMTKVGSRVSNQPTTGTGTEGLEQQMGSHSIQSMAKQAQMSARNEADSAQASHQKTISRGLSEMTKGGVSAKDVQRLGKNVSASEGTEFGKTIKQAESFAESNDFDAKQQEALKGVLALRASGEISTPEAVEALTGISGGIGASSESQSSSTQTQSSSMGSEMKTMIEEAGSKSVTNSFDETQTRASDNENTTSWENVFQDEQKTAYENSAQQARSAQESYQQASEVSAAVSRSQDLSVPVITEDIASDKQAFSQMEAYLSNNQGAEAAVRQRTEDLVDQDPNNHGSGSHAERRYKTQATLEHLSQNMDDQASQEQAMTMMSSTRYVPDDIGPDSVDATANKGVSGDVETGSGPRQEVENMTTELDPATVDQSIANFRSGAHKDMPAYQDASQEYRQSVNEIGEQTRQLDGVAGEQAYEKFRDRLSNESNPSQTEINSWAGSGISDMVGTTSDARDKLNHAAEMAGLSYTQRSVYTSQAMSKGLHGWDLHEGADEQQRDALYEEYKQYTDSDREARELANDTFDRIESAASAGPKGLTHVQDVAAVNKAKGVNLNERHGNVDGPTQATDRSDAGWETQATSSPGNRTTTSGNEPWMRNEPDNDPHNR